MSFLDLCLDAQGEDTVVSYVDKFGNISRGTLGFWFLFGDIKFKDSYFMR